MILPLKDSIRQDLLGLSRNLNASLPCYMIHDYARPTTVSLLQQSSKFDRLAFRRESKEFAAEQIQKIHLSMPKSDSSRLR